MVVDVKWRLPGAVIREHVEEYRRWDYAAIFAEPCW
jgi:hypothetical protein